MSASSWTITPERAKQIAFGDPYFSANQAILVQKDSDVTDARRPRGQDDRRAARHGRRRPRPRPSRARRSSAYDTSDDAFNALAQGRVDAAITDFPVVAYAAAQKPSLKVAAEVPGNLGLGLMFPQENTALRDAFNAGLAEIKADGTYDKIYEKWFGEAPTRSSRPARAGGAAPWTRSSISTSTGTRRGPTCRDLARGLLGHPPDRVPRRGALPGARPGARGDAPGRPRRHARAAGRIGGARACAASRSPTSTSSARCPALLVLLLMAGSFPFLPIPVVQDLTPFQIAFIGAGARRTPPTSPRSTGPASSRSTAGQTEAARSARDEPAARRCAWWCCRRPSAACCRR